MSKNETERVEPSSAKVRQRLNMLDLSVVIVACNEERIIGKTLEAVSPFAGEIIFVDSGSSDRTLEIARQYKAQCHHQQWLGYAAQKNFALSLASKSWILSLDADEIVSPELAKEITETIADVAKTCDGYRIPRILFIGKTALKHGGFYPDAQLRLFKNGKGKFIERKVHESAQVEGPVGKLNSPLLHYAYSDFADYAATLDRYAQLSAEEFASRLNGAANENKINQQREQNGQLLNWSLNRYWQTSEINETLHPIWTFCYRYFLRAGFLDGVDGLKANWIYKEYVVKKISYLRQRIK